MTRIPIGNVQESKPKPNVYTVLLGVAIIALVAVILIVGNFLMAPVENGQGYGLKPADLLEQVTPTDLPSPPN